MCWSCIPLCCLLPGGNPTVGGVIRSRHQKPSSQICVQVVVDCADEQNTRSGARSLLCWGCGQQIFKAREPWAPKPTWRCQPSWHPAQLLRRQLHMASSMQQGALVASCHPVTALCTRQRLPQLGPAAAGGGHAALHAGTPPHASDPASDTIQ